MNFVHENAVNLIQYNLSVLLLFLKTDMESGSEPTTLKTAGNQFIIGVSTPRALRYEVPQGSILEALLSTLYMPPTGCYCSP